MYEKKIKNGPIYTFQKINKEERPHLTDGSHSDSYQRAGSTGNPSSGSVTHLHALIPPPVTGCTEILALTTIDYDITVLSENPSWQTYDFLLLLLVYMT